MKSSTSVRRSSSPVAKIREFLGLERNILVLCLTGILINFGNNIYAPFLPLHFTNVGASLVLLGPIFSVLAIASAFITVPGGHFADRFGRKRITVLGSALMAVSMIPLYWVDYLPLVIACLVFVSFGMDVYRPGTYAMIVESVSVDKRATAFSMMGLIASQGALVAPIVGGYLSLNGDYRILFLVSAMSFIIMTLLRQMFLVETKARQGESAAKVASDEKGSLSFVEKLRLTWHSSSSTRAYLIFGVASALAGSMAGPYFAPYYLDILHLDQLQIGALVTASTIPNMIFQLPGGKLADKIGRKPLLLLGLVTYPVTVFAITQATNFDQLLLIELFSGTAGGLSAGSSYVLPAELVSEEYRATALGVFNTTSKLASALGPSIGGFVILLYPFLTFPRHVFYVSILAGIPSIVLFAACVKETLAPKT